MDLSIVIPAYNEAARICTTIQRTAGFVRERAWQAELVVVDDGSADATAQRVLELQRSAAGRDPEVRYLRNASNRGKGYSVRRGVSEARGRVIGFTDADYKTDIAALDDAMQALRAGADVVIADRTLSRTHIEVRRRAYRELGSRLFRHLVRHLVGLAGFPDTQCGFKFFRGDVARELFSLSSVDGFMFDVEILLLAVRRGYRVERIPVQWSDDADSRFRPVSGSLRNLRELVHIRRQTSFPAPRTS